MNSTFVVLYLMSRFCETPTSIDKNCEEGSPRSVVTLSLIGGDGPCDFVDMKECKPTYLFRLEIDGKIVASIPTSVLTPGQLEGLLLSSQSIAHPLPRLQQ